MTTHTGQPRLRQVLEQDPYFLVRNEANKQPLVKLRISRLSKLIGNPDLIAAYRAPPEAEAGGSRCVLCAPGRSQSSSSSSSVEVQARAVEARVVVVS